MSEQDLTNHLNAVLATWLFIHPHALDAFEAWLQSIGLGGHFLTHGANKVHLTVQQMKDAQAALPDQVMLIEQRAGEQIYVPPGFPHFVQNNAPTIKLAYDSLRIAQLPEHVIAHQTVNARLGFSATDYLEIPKLMLPLCAWADLKRQGVV
jgi:hypothetical protein